MKRFLLSVVLATTLAFTSCKFDDSDIWNAINEHTESIKEHEQRILALEELCKQMNTNIEALQTLVDALEKRDYITNISPIREDGVVIGYTISFANSDTITIYHGEDGKDGANGTDGKDGYTPQIGVLKDTDGIYYWTLDGEWLLDAKGNKIQANGVNGTDGTNGSNGTNGTNGVTPQLKIENDYWYVSYDNGATWVQLGKATGNDGLNGINGDSLFREVTIGDGFVIFTLNDGENSQIKLPFVTEAQLTVTTDQVGVLKELLTIEEQRSVTSLKIIGKINNSDLIFINTYLHSLEILDLADAIIVDDITYDDVSINPLGGIAPNRTLRHIIVGSQIKNGVQDGVVINISYCIALETLTMTKNHSRISDEALANHGDWPNRRGVLGSPNMSKLIIAEGVTELAVASDAYDNIYCVCSIIELPSSLEMIGSKIFGLYNKSIVICHATTPPSIYQFSSDTIVPTTLFYDAYSQMSKMTLYVPSDSVAKYKSTSGWSQFGTILPISE